jgi:hypothetical protein
MADEPDLATQTKQLERLARLREEAASLYACFCRWAWKPDECNLEWLGQAAEDMAEALAGAVTAKQGRPRKRPLPPPGPK